jgi:hypothetical protein
MAKVHNAVLELLSIERDLRRIPRLLEGIGAIALMGLESPSGIDQKECEAVHEISNCAVESDARDQRLGGDY